MSGLSTKPNLQKLIADIQECVSDLKRQCNESGTAINDDCKALQRFCAKLEYLLQYEQIDHSSFLGGRKDYWNYICDGLASTKGVRDGLKYVKSLGELKTSLGRGRAFIRFALTYQHLADSLQQCVNDRKLTREWYTPASVWLNDDQCRFLISVLYDLNDVRFDLGAKGYDLDNSWPLFARHDIPTHKWNVALSRTSSIGSLSSSYNDSSLKMDPVPFALGTQPLVVTSGGDGCETDGRRPRLGTDADMDVMVEEDAEAESVEERLTRELDQSELICSDLATRVGQLEGLLQAADRAKEAATARLDSADERSGALEMRCIELERAVAAADEEVAELKRQLTSEHDAHLSECERLREALRVESDRRVELEERQREKEEAVASLTSRLDIAERSAAELAHSLKAADGERHLAEQRRDGAQAELELLASRLAEAQSTAERSRITLRDAFADLLRIERTADLPSFSAHLAGRVADICFVDASERDVVESSIGQFVRRLQDEAARLVAAEAAAKAERAATEAAAALELQGATSAEQARLLQTVAELTGALRRADAQRAELEEAAVAAQRLTDEMRDKLQRQAVAERDALNATATLAEQQKAAVAERESAAAAALDEALAARRAAEAELAVAVRERDGALADARAAASEAAAARLEALGAAESLRHLDAQLKDLAEQLAVALRRADSEREAALGEAAAEAAAALKAALAAAAAEEEVRRDAALDELRTELASRAEEAERCALSAAAARLAEMESRLRDAESAADEQRRRADAAVEAERALRAEAKAERAEFERAAAAWSDERRDRDSALQTLKEENEAASHAAAAQLSAALASRDEARAHFDELQRSTEERALEWRRTEENCRRECDAAAECVRRATEERDAAAAAAQRQLEEAARTADLVAGDVERALGRAAAAEAERERATAELDLVSRDFGELKDTLRSLKQTEAEKSTALARLQVELDRTRAEFERSHATTEQQISALRFQLSSQQLECEMAIEGYRTQQAEVQQLSGLLTRQEEIIGVLESALQTLGEEKRVEHDLHLRQLQELNREMATKDEERQANATFFDTVHAELEKERQTRRKLQDELIGMKMAAGEQAATKENELHRMRDENADLRRKLVKLIRDKDNLWQKTDALVYRQKQRAEVKWMDDSVVTNCISCSARFSLTLRKHHCRLCGRIFCHNCSNNWVDIASSSRKARACNACFADHDPDGSLNSSLLEASVITNGGDDDGSGEDSFAASVIAAGRLPGSTSLAAAPADGDASTSRPHVAAIRPAAAEAGDEESNVGDSEEPFAPRLRRELLVSPESSSGTLRSSERDVGSRRASSASNGSAAWRLADGPPSRPQSNASLSTTESDGAATTTTLESDQRLELRAGGGTAAVPVPVDEAETTLTWRFSSAPKGIAFSVSYLPSRDAPIDSAEVLVPRSKCSSHRGPVSGHLIAHQSGVYVFTFENAGARSPDAIVTYAFRVISPSHCD